LQDELNLKLNLTGGTLTGALDIGLSALGTTPTAALSLINATAAGAGAQQVSPSLLLEGRGWKTNATAASQIVRFRQNLLPVQGAANPTATWQLQSEINNSGTWVNNLVINSATGGLRLQGDTSDTLWRRTDTNQVYFGATNDTGTAIGANAGSFIGVVFGASGRIAWSSDTPSSTIDISLVRDAAHVLAQRNAANAQENRIYGTYTNASNYRRVSKGMSLDGVAFIRPEGAGTGASGNVLHISGLPTSNPGPGILWNDGGTPAIGT
jgi:hypothetical protein